MKIISCNVNGLRAFIKKDGLNQILQLDPDIICLQEIKVQPDQLELSIAGYQLTYHSAQKKGYAGTAIITKRIPNAVRFGLDDDEDLEGRVLMMDFDEFILINVYTPNAQPELKRLDYRLLWERNFRNTIAKLQQKKPVIICGDLNVAHQPIDLKNPQANKNNPGFTQAERDAFNQLLKLGLVDTFRALYPEKKDAYTWWSYMNQARANNSGWRIDYFLVSNYYYDQVVDSIIYPDIMGSDHCPVGLILK